MSIVHVRQVIIDGKKTFEVGQGVSLYTPYTTHYDLDDSVWNLPLTSNSVMSALIYCKVKGQLPPKSKLPNPRFKRKL